MSEIVLSQTENSFQNSSTRIIINFKLDGDNYPLWSRLMRVAIGGKGKLRHITGEPEPPAKTDEAFAKWEENDLTVFSWILQNIETRFINSVAEYQTVKELWDALETTYK